MTRNVKISISSALLVLALAFGGVAFAQSSDPSQGPLNAILTALRLIKEQTNTVADSMAQALSGLVIVHSQLNAVAGSVASGQQAESQILKVVQALQQQLDQLEAGQRPAPSAHRLWVSPFWANSRRGGDDGFLSTAAVLQTRAQLVVLNPGDIEAAFNCIFLGQNGIVLSGDGPPYYAGPGNWSGCEGPDPFQGFGAGGWLIVTSDRPVLPNGSYVEARDYSSAAHRTVQAIEFHPIDCTNPADDTVSFACRYAKPPR
jgi:hypothetical protein